MLRGEACRESTACEGKKQGTEIGGEKVAHERGGRSKREWWSTGRSRPSTRPRATPHDTPIPLRAVWRARVFARPCVGATQRSDIARGNQPPACSPPNTAGAAGGRLLLGGGRAAPRRDAASSHRPVRARVRLPGGSAARAPAGARQRLLRGHLPTSAPRAKPAAARRARCAPRPRGRRRGGGWPR